MTSGDLYITMNDDGAAPMAYELGHAGCISPIISGRLCVYISVEPGFEKLHVVLVGGRLQSINEKFLSFVKNGKNEEG